MAERLGRASHNLRAALQEAVNEATPPAVIVQPEAIERLLLFAAASVNVCGRTGIYDACRPYIAAAIAVGTETATAPRARLLLAAARVSQDDGEPGQAAAYIDEALSIFRSLHDSSGVGDCLALLAEFAEEAGRHRAAQSIRSTAHLLGQEASAAKSNAPPPADSIDSLDLEDLLAAHFSGETIAAQRQSSHELAGALALDAMCSAALERGDLDAARTYLGQSLDLWHSLNDTRRVASALENMAVLACMEDKQQWAASLYIASRRLRLKDDAAKSEFDLEAHRTTDEWFRRRIDAELLEHAEREDRAVGIDAVLANPNGPILRIVVGGKPGVSGVPTAQEASLKP